MKDRHSTSDLDAAPKYDAEYWAHFLDDLDADDFGDGPHLISVDELRAAGALDVPPGWRTSLGVEKKPATGLFADEALWSPDPAEPNREDAE